MVKIVDMTSALQQVREKTVSEDHKVKFATKPGEKIAVASYKDKEAAEKFKKDVIAKGGKAIVTSEELSMKATFLNGDDKTFKGKTASDINKQVKEYEKKHNTGLQHDGPMVKEDLNKDDESVVKKVRDMLKGASDKHKSQAKVLDKALKSENEKNLEETKVYRVSHPSKKTAEVEGDNENDAIQRYKRYHKLGSTSGIKATLRKQSPYPSFTSKIPTHQYGGTKGGKPVYIKTDKNLEEQKKELEEQLKTAEKQLEELYIKEDKAYVIRFKRIKDKERMVVVFRNQHDADMYADNIKKQGGQVFSNKLEKIPFKVVDKK
jgi:hypothetical protein